MIVFPNLENYISDYKSDDNVITIRMYEYPNKVNAKYFNVRTPFPYGAFVEMLQELANQMQLNNLRIEQVTRKYDTEEINIWQLAWYLRNIRRNRIANITIHRENNSDITYKFNADDEECVNKLIKIIKNNAY